MPKSSVRWRFEGGYSRLLDRPRVEVILEDGPTRQQLKLSPLGLFKEPTELTLRFTQSYRATGPGRLRWRLSPETRIRAVVLQPGNAYLGNFRVPEGQYAIQWDIAGEVTSKLLERFSTVLLSAEAGSTLVHTWVTLFARETSLLCAVRESWKGFIDPFRPEEILRLSERQVVRFRWSGRLITAIGIEWGIGRGWQVGVSRALLDLQAALRAKAEVGAEVRFSQQGHFGLRLSKRMEQIQLSISKDRKWTHLGRFAARATLRDTVKAEPAGSGLKPLVQPLNRKLAEAVARRAEIAFLLEAERWRRRRLLFKAVWKKPSDLLIKEYGSLLSGSLPGRRPGLKLNGRIEAVRGKRVSVSLNILSWIRLGKSSERKRFYRSELGPSGEVTVEEGRFLEKTRYRWEELQLVSLLCTQSLSDVENPRKFLWTFQMNRLFDHRELATTLKKALHLSSISSFDLPGQRRFPLHLDLCWCSEFSSAGINAIRRSSAKKKWDALVTALEISRPDLYGKGRFLMDWVSSKAVRETIDLSPVQSHLASVYPLPGRSSFERKQVVSTYLRVKKFLRLIAAWEKGREEKLLEAIELDWELPVFFWFHLLCPRNLRKSVLILTGELDRVWGEPEIIDSPADP